MRDSWIDRKEFEELVGAFPEGKKASRRRPLPHLPKGLSPEAPAPDLQAPAPEESEGDLAAEVFFRQSEEAINPGFATAKETTSDPVDRVLPETSGESDRPPAIESEPTFEPIPKPVFESVFELVFEVVEEFEEIAPETADRDSPLPDEETGIHSDSFIPEKESVGSFFSGIQGSIKTDPSEETMVLRDEDDDDETIFMDEPGDDDERGHFFSRDSKAFGIPVDPPEMIEPAHSDFLRSGSPDLDFPGSEPNEGTKEHSDVPSPETDSLQRLFGDTGQETEDGRYESDGLGLDVDRELDIEEEEPVSREDFLKREPDSDDESGDVFTVIVEETSAFIEAPLRDPSFLDVSDALVETHRSPVSDREADRAVRSLAEARARVDRSHLIRPKAAVNITTVEEAGDSPESPTSSDDSLSELHWVEEDFVFVPHGAFHERIVQFGDDMQREFGTSELEVFDESGLLLYSSSGSIGPAATSGVQLFEISDQMTGMLGLGEHSATQVVVDNDAWQCLISGAGKAGNLCAVFTVAEPLDQRRVAVLRAALADAVNPDRRAD